MTNLNVASVIIEGLKSVGIDRLYCLPGVQNDDFFNALYDQTDQIKVVNTRHEQGAGYMALGAAMATGKPQAYCVVPGPGLLNSSGALATAFGLCVPVFALVGQIPSSAMGKMYGLLHELPDQLAILSQITKHAEGIYDSEMAVGQVQRLMTELTSGQPRPVGLEVPMDVWGQAVERADIPLSIERQLPALDEDAIESAAKLLGQAKRPLIVLGGGAQDAGESIRELAEMVQAPFTGFRMGRGVVDERHPLWVAWPSAHRLWETTDVVVAIGTRLQIAQMGWGRDDDLKIIHINLDAEELGRHGSPTVGLHADARQTVTRLVDRVGAYNRKRTSREGEVRQLQAELAQKISHLEPQLSYLEAIRAELPEDGIFVEDLTQVGFVGRFAYPVYQPRTYICSGYPGTLGMGYATALGIQEAMPERKVLSVNGDGGFMYTASELATAIKYHIPLTAIVFADGAYGNVKRIQQERYDGRTIASDLVNPDFVKLAESYGALGLRAETPDQLRAALQEAFKANHPALIEVPVGEMPSPWEFMLLPRMRGDGVSGIF